MEKKLILIVDDDEDLSRSLQIILENQGFEVFAAQNKTEGFKLLEERKPDLILLDIMMESTLEGYNMLHKIKNDENYKDIPVIMITGMADELGVNFRAAVEDPDVLPGVIFMDKPVDQKELLTEINNFLFKK
ncbi:MAG: response regulator [Bacteroidales bacterium]|nr:response regulator [Bacteroidales bacterium]